MGRASIGQAKNVLERALRAILDRELSKNDASLIWKHFKSSCAYCGKRLSRSGRKGHLDHLVHRGTNHISNRVLACGVCNGDKKRDRDWREFLREESGSNAVFLRRKRNILVWVNQHKSSFKPHRRKQIVEREVLKALQYVERAAMRLRGHRLPPN